MGLATAFSYTTESAVMMSAREVDAYEYFTSTGVVIKDIPVLDPHFSGLRVAMCNKKFMYLDGNRIDFPCFASQIDMVSANPKSHMMQSYKIMKSSVPESSMKAQLGSHMAYLVDFNN